MNGAIRQLEHPSNEDSGAYGVQTIGRSFFGSHPLCEEANDLVTSSSLVYELDYPLIICAQRNNERGIDYGFIVGKDGQFFGDTELTHSLSRFLCNSHSCSPIN